MIPSAELVVTKMTAKRTRPDFQCPVALEGRSDSGPVLVLLFRFLISSFSLPPQPHLHLANHVGHFLVGSLLFCLYCRHYNCPPSPQWHLPYTPFAFWHFQCLLPRPAVIPVTHSCVCVSLRQPEGPLTGHAITEAVRTLGHNEFAIWKTRITSFVWSLLPLCLPSPFDVDWHRPGFSQCKNIKTWNIFRTRKGHTAQYIDFSC